MTAQRVEQNPIQINWAQDGTVTVLGQDKHRFVMTMQEAADACSRGRDQIVFAEEFKRLLGHVHNWIQDHAELVSAAYFSIVERQLIFFVLPKGEHMDFQLSDAIAQLEVELFHDFANARCEVRQVPGHNASTVSTFIDLGKAILLYGQPRRTPDAMD